MSNNENFDDHHVVILNARIISFFHSYSGPYRGALMKIRHLLFALIIMVAIAGCEIANMELPVYSDMTQQEYDLPEAENDSHARPARQIAKAVERWRYKTYTYTYTNFNPARSTSYTDTYHYPYVNSNCYDYRDRVYLTSTQRQRLKYFRDSRGRTIERRYYNMLDNPATKISWQTYSYNGSSSNYSQYTSLGTDSFIGSRYLYTYDTQGNMTEEKMYGKYDIVPSYANQWIYDGSGNMIQVKNNNYKQNYSQTWYVTTQRDESNRVESEKYYNDIAKTDLNEEIIYSYDQAGNLISYIISNFDGETKLSEYRYSYTYESYNNY